MSDNGQTSATATVAFTRADDQNAERPLRHTGFTGTQDGMTQAQVLRVRLILMDVPGWLHHGDCIGADRQANDLAHDLGLAVAVHPPANSAKRAFCGGSIIHPPQGYIQRNHAIVDASHSLIAAPKEFCETRRSGTWATIRYARAKNRPVLIVFPDGHSEAG